MSEAACIDIGTNSVLLSVAQPAPNGWIEEVDYDQKITQLGQESQIGGTLKSKPMAQTRKAVREMVVRSRNQGAEAVYLVGTQALRKAKNAEYFTDMIRHDTGLDVNIISGEEESRLGFVAVAKSLPDIPQKIVMDIGGGSTELALGKKGQVTRARSIPVGCMVLTEQFIYPAELPGMRDYLKAYLGKELPDMPTDKASLIGVGGTVTTLAAIQLKLEQYDAAKVHGHTMTKAWVTQFSDKFVSMSQKEKLTLSCASPERLYVLGPGMEIVLGMMSLLGKDVMVVSDSGLRHAVLWEHFNTKESGQE